MSPAREGDALLGTMGRSSNPNATIASDPGARRFRRLAYVALFVLSFLVIAFLTAVVLRPPSRKVSSDIGDEGSMRASQQDKKRHKHKHISKKVHKNKYNDIFSAAADSDNVINLDESDEEEGLEEVDISPTSTNGDSMLLMEKSHHKKCDDGGYSKRTLKRAYEMPLAALFQDNRGQKKFEASDVIIVNQTYGYAVCDSLWSISEFRVGLPAFSPDNRQIGDPNRDPTEDSGYEAIFYDDGSFYVIRESVLHQTDGTKGESYHAIVEQLLVEGDDYTIVEECRCDFEFEGDSKGYEGAIAIHDLDGKLTILGLCEGNHCSEARKKDKGNGMLIAMQKVNDEKEGCVWKTVRQISLPSSVEFTDYSAIAIDGKDRIAITSQEDSTLYVGKMTGKDPSTGFWDIDSIAFDTDKEKVYDFPKNDACDTIYCNIEGIHWLDNNMLMAVSDKMKSKGKQDHLCFDKDQSVHAFVLP
mmetsp:Transcript_11421/g.18961  ORF Transcript_11421/g.18961 Transcript_11421/m.18961 type:complete len:472 (+) Transcript_11421:244-1659(+)|eukprot:CAMPEP_0119015718 /NCGR_PEP_ID=MMETSP1176-20130426/11481_1 /TAXON_ID=265551 /ORGANISM="Synedropsis recta cf, Strain CCMP1620" /LENGTH=471 /DNA_ID=CAMNT_0006969031 /DNA_START=244 /DNA_END=1659 /DNA_ORIENTATION=+